MKKVIFFDFNGVLANSEKNQEELIAKYLKVDAQKLKIFYKNCYNDPEFRAYFERPMTYEIELAFCREYARLILNHFDSEVTDEKIEAIVKLKTTSVFEINNDVKLVLDGLKEKFRFGIISNARPTRRINEIEGTFLKNYIDKELTFITSEYGLNKSSMKIFEIAHKAANCELSNIIFCDDNVKYLQVAKEYGITNLVLFGKEKSDWFLTVKNLDEFAKLPILSRV